MAYVIIEVEETTELPTGPYAILDPGVIINAFNFAIVNLFIEHKQVELAIEA